MRLAVLDTNVLVSAAIRRESPPGAIVNDWVLEGRVQVMTCPAIVEEYRTVLRRPRFSRYGLPPEWLEFVMDESLHLPDPAPWPLPIPEASDAVFLALAREAGAWLVTGNQRHFPESGRSGVTVVSPAEYLAWLRRGEPARP